MGKSKAARKAWIMRQPRSEAQAFTAMSRCLNQPCGTNQKGFMRLKVFTAFSGYDSQCLALRRLGIDYELVGYSEIDKYAIQAHNALFPEAADRNYGDICKIDWAQVPDFDLFTYSFPCTDISAAGQQKGLDKGSGTRSSLLWECERAIEIKRPKYLLMENVKALVQKKFVSSFNEWQTILEGYGYANFAKVLNAKDYGVPQNRERIFLVSIRMDGLEGLAGNVQYYFPQPMPLDRRLKDVLEAEVDEKYYLSEKMMEYFNRVNADTSHCHKFKPKDGEDTAFTIRTAPGERVDDNFIKEDVYKRSVKPLLEFIEEAKIEQVGNLYDTDSFGGNPQRGRVYSDNGLAPGLQTSHGGGHEPKVVLGWTRDSKGKVVNRHPVEVANCVTASKRDNTQNYVCCAMSRRSENIAFKVMPNGNIRAYQTDKPDKRGVSELQFTNPENKLPTVITGNTIKVIEKMADQNAITGVASGCRIRKLTPRECFRLMGVDDADIDTIQAAGISNSQQYKMAGNSIVVDVLYHIFRKLLVEPGQEGNSQTLF